VLSRFFTSLLSQAALVPLQQVAFRMLWTAWLIANVSMAMSDVASAWLMTTMTTSPMMVALVQTASTLPVFLIGIGSGALADIVDRRRYFAATQLWVASIGMLIAILAFSGLLNPPLLLLLTFLNGIGLALRWPVFSAIIPEVVGRANLPQALALSAISMNLSRVVGPVVAGALIAGVGGGAVFTLNAIMALIAFYLIIRWKSTPKKSPLPGERFFGAMRVGLQHVRQSPRMRVVLIRIFVYFFQSTCLMAFLPLVAKSLSHSKYGAGPGMFTILLACMGIGAVATALSFPYFRERYTRDGFVRYGIWGHAITSVLIVLVPEVWVAIPAMILLGTAWISAANSLSLSAQMALPNWVRARGMSVYQMALMGGAALGALFWGQVAEHSSIQIAVIAAAALGVLFVTLTHSMSVDGGEDVDFTPVQSAAFAEPAVSVEPDDGPVMVTVEYQVDPVRAAEFKALMEETRQARLRLGVLSWELLRDASNEGRYVEYFLDESWVEHLRRQERFTASDVELRERRLAFQMSGEAPKVSRYIVQT
jgi:MFS family permease/quinol monooxygenase YgiN